MSLNLATLLRESAKRNPDKPAIHIGDTTLPYGMLDGLAQNPPDLAILDIKMPRMDGMELLRKLRQSTDLPVIFLTSKDDEIDELFGLKMGADDFIKKPFSQRLLVERVKAVLRRASPRDGTAARTTEQSRILERGQLTMDQERHTCTWNGQNVTLTIGSQTVTLVPNQKYTYTPKDNSTLKLVAKPQLPIMEKVKGTIENPLSLEDHHIEILAFAGNGGKLGLTFRKVFAH